MVNKVNLFTQTIYQPQKTYSVHKELYKFNNKYAKSVKIKCINY